MGVYYTYMNHDKKEFINLSNVGLGGIKSYAAMGISAGPALLAFALSGPWKGDKVTVEADNEDTYFEAMDEGSKWKDISLTLQQQWKMYFLSVKNDFSTSVLREHFREE